MITIVVWFSESVWIIVCDASQYYDWIFFFYLKTQNSQYRSILQQWNKYLTSNWDLYQLLVRGDGALPNGSVTHLLSKICNPNLKIKSFIKNLIQIYTLYFPFQYLTQEFNSIINNNKYAISMVLSPRTTSTLLYKK